MGNIRPFHNRTGKVPPEGDDAEVGDQEQKHLPGQDSQNEENRVLDALHLREKVLGRQGAGEEHRPDEQRFQETVSQAGEHYSHQQDGYNPVRYDQEPFHRTSTKLE